MVIEPCIIVGTGPAGLMAARAAVAAGIRPTIIDAGERESSELSQRRQASITALAGGEGLPAWAAQPPQSARGPIPVKRILGSDESHRPHPGRAGGDATAERLWVNAVGGFSRVWGCALATFTDADMSDWPPSARLTRTDYEAAADAVHIAGHDSPVYRMIGPPRAPDVELSAPRALSALTSATGGPWLTGPSTLALAGHNGLPHCRNCGTCLTGCPWRVLFDAHDAITALADSGAVTLRTGELVVGVEEHPAAVTVTARTACGEALSLRTDRLILACGSVGTTILASRLLGRALRLRDCQAFTLPMIDVSPRSRGGRVSIDADAAGSLAHATLARVFLERCGTDGRTALHVQAYPPGPEIRAALQRTLLDSRLPRALRGGATEILADRAMACHGFLPAACSGSLVIDGRSTTQQGDTARGSWALTREVGNTARLRREIRLLTRLLARHGYATLAALARVEPVGGGYHHSASLPIGSPDGTDDLGRLPGASRIHLADAASLPLLPPQPPTLSIMAHAHRVMSRIIRAGLLSA